MEHHGLGSFLRIIIDTFTMCCKKNVLKCANCLCHELLYLECFINLHLILLCSLHVQRFHLILCLKNLFSPLAHCSASPSNTNQGLFWLEVGEGSPSPALMFVIAWSFCCAFLRMEMLIYYLVLTVNQWISVKK